jgi:hypothetical protein
VTVVGKRGKVRSILLPISMWRELVTLCGDAGPDDPVFRSRQGGALDPMSVERVVKAARYPGRPPQSRLAALAAPCPLLTRARSRRQPRAGARHRRTCRSPSNQRVFARPAKRQLGTISCRLTMLYHFTARCPRASTRTARGERIARDGGRRHKAARALRGFAAASRCGARAAQRSPAARPYRRV